MVLDKTNRSVRVRSIERASGGVSRMLSRKKKIAFNLVFILCVPVFLVLLELSFRIAGVGYDTRPFVRSQSVPEYYTDNPEYYFKYYPDYRSRQTNKPKNLFSYKKEPGTLRGFVIGESTAEGFPFHSNHSFSRILEKSLSLGKKYKNVEIVNLGFSAMASYYIKDAALKVLDYEPDFIVIYGGHNEVYGTVSYTTGGNYLSRSLYLKLKELRTFQLFCDLKSSLSGGADANKTLMAKQFNRRYVPSSEKTDLAIAGDFVRNIRNVVHAYDAKNIPVIIVEPVSNLVDMPPFAGENDEKYKSFIGRYIAAVSSHDDNAAMAVYSERLKHPEYNENAVISYLDAVYSVNVLKKFDIALFNRAKDLDCVPFRMRSASVRALRDFVRTNASDPNLHYIPTYDFLAGQFGPVVFSNRIFIDQLHFNFTGQLIMANLLSNQVEKIFGYDADDMKKIAGYFSDTKRIKQDIGLLPYFEIDVFSTIAGLVSDYPFKTMTIPYRIAPFEKLFPGNDIFADKEFLRKVMDELGTPRAYSHVLEYYAAKKDFTTGFSYCTAAVKYAPTDPDAYLGLAKAYRLFPGAETDAVRNFIMAYRFSNRSEKVFSAMSTYLVSIGRQKSP